MKFVFIAKHRTSDRTYGARRVWRDLLADGADCGLLRIPIDVAQDSEMISPTIPI
jgi:hypothetical protein